MDREEIMRLTKRQLFEQVAEKIMGWQWIDDNGDRGLVEPTNTFVGDTYIHEAYWPTRSGKHGAEADTPPYGMTRQKWYAWDMGAAWEVVERVVEMLSIPGSMGGERTAVFTFYRTRVRAAGCDYNYFQAVFRYGVKKTVVSVVEENGPEAICRAALMAANS